LDLKLLQDKLADWISQAGNSWSSNGLDITNSWLKGGLEERCITRDLKWGTPVPHPAELPELEQFKNKASNVLLLMLGANVALFFFL